MFRKLDKFIEYFIFSLLSLMSTAIFLQVVFRYVIKYSLPWSEELARYLFVWFALMGAAVAVKDNAHFGVDFLVFMMSNDSNFSNSRSSVDYFRVKSLQEKIAC